MIAADTNVVVRLLESEETISLGLLKTIKGL